MLHGDVPLQAPSVVLPDSKVHVTAGPMWVVKLADLPTGTMGTMHADLLCIPNEKEQAKNPFRKQVKFSLAVVDPEAGTVALPPWYAHQVLPNALLAPGLTLGRAMGPAVAFTGALRTFPPQRQAADSYFGWLKAQPRGHPTSAILSLPCGYGKTVLCLHLVAALNRVTLVLAHTNALVDQWLEEARRFLGPGARLGWVKADDNVRVDDVDVVVASLASLLAGMRRGADFVARLQASVGTLVLDEGHHAVATTFWQVMGAMPAHFRIVLTATPRRRDGLMNQLQWVTGPVIFRAFRKVDDVHVVHVKFTGPGHVPMERRDRMVAALCGDVTRTALAADLAAYLVHEQRRRVVLVTPLVEHVLEVGAAVEERLRTAGVAPRPVRVFVAHKFKAPRRKPSVETAEQHTARVAAAQAEWTATGPHGEWRDVDAPLVGRVLAGSTTADRDLAFEGHAVVATDTMLAEGVSYKAWDTLVYLGNSFDCEQVVGRILREDPGKQTPLVVEVHVPVGTFAAAHAARGRYYRAEGFTQWWAKGTTWAPGGIAEALNWNRFVKHPPAVRG